MRCKSTSRIHILPGVLLALALLTAGAHGAEVRSRAEGDALVAAQSDNPGAYMTYANFLVDQNQLDGAIAVLEQGRDQAEPSAELQVALAELYIDRQMWAKAEAAAAGALALDEDNFRAQVVIGEAYFALGWHRSGLDAFRAAMAMDPAATLPKVRLVGGLLEDGQLAEAEEQCLRFVSGDPDNAELWMSLGRVFEHQGKHREAFTTYGQALSLDPELAHAYARQGKLFCEFGQYQAAEHSCRRALDLDEGEALAHAYLGIALSHLGNSDEARLHAEIAEAAGLNMTSVWRKLDK